VVERGTLRGASFVVEKGFVRGVIKFDTLHKLPYLFSAALKEKIDVG
jgi:hypothetical protein